MEARSAVISTAYNHVILRSLVAQLAVGCLAVLMLDGGVTARVVGVAALGFWLCVALVIFRRPSTPTKFDLAFVRWGFWPILAIALLYQSVC